VHYQGDTNYAADDAPCETVTIDKASATATTEIHAGNDHATDVQGTSLSLDSTVHDKAIVTGNGTTDVTGKADFTFFSNGTCTPGATNQNVIATDLNRTLTSGSPATLDNTTFAQGPLDAGTYSFLVHYQGDTNDAADDAPCETVTIEKANSSTSTEIHLANESAAGSSVPLGSSIHDKATVSGNGTTTPTGNVTFTFFSGGNCTTGTSAGAGTVTLVNGVAHPSTAETNLAAGDYAFRARYNGDSNYQYSVSDCEPITVNQAQLTIGTKIHDANHNVIPDGSVVPLTNNVLHDTAQVGGKVGTFGVGAVTFTFYTGGNCVTGTATLIATSPNADTASGDPRSVDTSALSVGSYAFKASVAGNSNYLGATSGCEPFSVASIGKTMGYWGNKNGIARIQANGGYAANSENIGRGAVIDTKEEALKVLPNTLNACGKGSPTIFSGQTTTTKCSLAKGVNESSLDTLAAQTLALGYNIKILPSFNGQTLAQLACTQYATAGLTGSSTVNQVLTVAVALIDGSGSGGSTMQSQIGAMNQLLGCVNREI
jgi:hypothetical protein